ncbi:MAG TPA: hypothetical protein VG389_06610 [Myxococcota bacterium]|jgi:hypothetical protein|nr:hypothetical protein [Myxococcota bacterium]
MSARRVRPALPRAARAAALALLAVAGAGAGAGAGCRCASFPFNVDEFRCATTAECTGGRVCEEGFCVVAAGDAATDAGADGGGGPDSGGDGGGGPDSGPIGCTSNGDCTALTTACTTGTCNLADGTCVATNDADGTPCDDGVFCTDPDTCTAGACGGGPRDCTSVADACNGSSCDEAAAACAPVPVVDGSPCSDGLFCTDPDTCTAGACGGPPNPCADTNACTADACDEGANACVHDPTPLSGAPCDDGLFCTVGETCDAAGACGGAAPRVCPDDGLFCTGPESCDEAADACVSSPVMCAGDGYTCTVETCVEALSGCDTTRTETLCAAAQICNEVAYPAGGTGCGAAPTTFTAACPAAQPAGGAGATCTLTLTAGATPIPGEAGRISCTAQPVPLVLFTDDFTGGLDPAWVTASGTPATNTALAGNEAAVAVNGSWSSDVTVGVTGLQTLCVDFDAAQANSVAGDRIRWDFRFDAGAFSTVFDLDFGTWENSNVMFTFNRNVCAAIPGGTTTATLRLRLDGPGNDVWVDNVAVTGLAAALVSAPGGGPDLFADLSGWTTVSGTPTVGAFAGSNVLYAENATYSLERTVDATACDVLDVNFDFGRNNTNAGETITLAVSVDGGAFSTVEFLDLNGGGFDVNSVLLPWFGLRRITDLDPAAAGSASVVFRFTMAASGGGRRVYVDVFDVPCADLPDPTLGPVTDAGGGSYTVTVSSTAPEGVTLTCTWATTDDGPLTAADTTFFTP